MPNFSAQGRVVFFTTCRRDNARVIFVQQEFDTRNARLIADELGVTVVPINPLSYEWREEMINVANALAK